MSRLVWRPGYGLRRDAQGRWAHIYQQTFIDPDSKVAFAKLSDRKTSLTAAELLNAQVVPFFDAPEVPLSRLLTDRGTEYWGSPDSHH
jgi:hypothetical protein